MLSKVDVSSIAVFFTACLLFGILNSITVAMASVTIEDILEGIRNNESLVKSWKGTLVLNSEVTEIGKQNLLQRLKSEKNEMTFPAFGIKAQNVVSYYFKGRKFRNDIKGTAKMWDGNKEWEEKEEIVLVYDGETFSRRTISINGISVQLDSTPFFNPQINPKFLGFDTQGKSFSDLIISMSPELVGTEILDDELCYIIKLNPPVPPDTPPEGLGNYRIWLDTQKGYAIKKIEFSSQNNLSVTINKYKEISKDIWILYLQECKGFIIDPTTGNQNLESASLKEIKDQEINVDIPDEVFKISFEKGTQVYDARTKESYVVE